MSQSPTIGPIDAAIRGQAYLPQPPRPQMTAPLVDREAPTPPPQREPRSFSATFSDAWDANAIQPAFNRMMDRVGLFQKTDPGFSLTPELMGELSVGIPENQLGQFKWAVNRDHAVLIRNQILERNARRDRLAADGWSGVVASMVASMADPNAWMIDGLATVATLPLGGAGGYASRANKVRKAIDAGFEAAQNAGRLGATVSRSGARTTIAASKTAGSRSASMSLTIGEGLTDPVRYVARSRLALAGQAGLQGALANSAIEGILAADGESDLRGVAMAGVIGFGTVGTLSMVGTRQMSRDARAAAELMRNIDESEIVAMGSASQTGMWYDMARAWRERMTDPVERQAIGLEPLEQPSLAGPGVQEVQTRFSDETAREFGAIELVGSLNPRLQTGRPTVMRDLVRGFGGDQPRLTRGRSIAGEGRYYAFGGTNVSAYGSNTENVAALRLENPLVLTPENALEVYSKGLPADGDTPEIDFEKVQAAVDYMEARGHDGLIYDATQTSDEFEDVAAQLQEQFDMSQVFIPGSRLDEVMARSQPVKPDLAKDFAKLQRDVKIAQARRVRDHVMEAADSPEDAKALLAATDDELLEIVEHEARAMEQLNELAVTAGSGGGGSGGPGTTLPATTDSPQPRPKKSIMRITANVSGSNAKWSKIRVGGAATLSRMTARTPTGRVFAEAVLGDTLPRANGKVIGLGVKDQADALVRGAADRVRTAQKQLISNMRKQGGGFVRGSEIQEMGVAATRWLREGRPESAPRAVKEYGESLGTIFNDYFNLSADAGVPGAARVGVPDANYVPQVPSAERFHQFMQQGPEQREALQEAISQAWLNANEDILDDLGGRVDDVASAVGRGYVRRLLDSRLETSPFSEFDFDRMAGIIREELAGKVAEDDVNTLLRSLRPTGEQGTVPSRFRSRTPLDLSVEVPGTGGTPLSDFYEQDLGILAQSYARDMARASARQSALNAINGHFGLEGEDAIENVQSLVARIEREVAASDLTEKRRKAVMREIKQVADALEGRPLMNQSRSTQAFRIGKSLATATFGGSFGLAQQVESGTAAATVGVQRFFNAAPAAGVALSDAIRGVPVSNEVMKLMDYMGHGVGDAVMLGDYFRGSARSIDEFTADAATGGRGFLDRADAVSQKLARTAIISGGMEHTEAFQRRTVSLAAYDWVVDSAMKGLKSGDAIRMGLDDVRARRLESAVKKWEAAGIIKRDGRVLDMDVQRAFDMDADAFYDLRDAIGFIQSNVIQRQRLASVPPAIARNQIVNAMAQFRGFAIGAYEQQLLLNVAAKDAASFATAGYTMAIAALVAVIQENARLTAQGATQEEREEALAWDRIGRIAFRRAGWASMFPDLADSVVQVGGYNPIFSEQARVSGLSNNIMDPGNYAIAGMMDNWAKAFQAATRMAVNGEVAQEDARGVARAMPLQNNVFLRFMSDKFASQFPEREELRDAGRP